MLIKISVKWNGKKFDEISVDTEKPAALLKEHLFGLTNVEPSRQKIMAKGGLLKDDADLSKAFQDGAVYMMMGTVGSEIPKEPVQPVKFIEDMSAAEVNVSVFFIEIIFKALSEPFLKQNVPAGLQNLGNTCYMNASLQCLKVIPELNDTLSAMKGSFGGDPSSNLVVAMRDLFKLLSSNENGVSPLIFLQTMRAQYPQFAQQDHGRYMQQDAEECFSALLSTLDNNLFIDEAKKQSFVSKYMTGFYEKTMKCDEAPEEASSVTMESFSRLQCHISTSVNYLNQGLQESMKEVIEKNSPTLGRLAKYTQTLKISKLPKYLTVGFVRFFWKQDTRTKAKIMRAVKYPFELDVNEFCSADLQKKIAPARELLNTLREERESNKNRRLNENGDKESSSTRAKPESVYLDQLREKGMDPDMLNDEGCCLHAQYDLQAVLTHVGRSADAGHYMAWVKDQHDPEDKKWWKFDDDTVSAVTRDDVEKLYGGGDWHMAYLLVYKARTFQS